MRTKEEIQAEADKLDDLRATCEPGPRADQLEAYSDALQWVLGTQTDSPTERA